MKTFSLWCDFIENSFLDTRFLAMLNKGIVNAATSNPAIFKNAILSSPVYKEKIKNSKAKFKSALYEELVVADIRKAADKLALNYYQKNDGFISVEIDPHLADDTEGSIAEALRLYSDISRANVMIKLPATQASYPVMSELLAQGINVNATLVFSQKQTKECIKALKKGLKRYRKSPAHREPQAVISVFVSRFDRALGKHTGDEIGILNATKAYNMIERAGEPHIRTLFASTGVKGDELEKDYYIKALLFPHSINTAPLDAIAAFERELRPVFKKPLNDFECEAKISKYLSLDELEILSDRLLKEGLEQFNQAFDEILAAL